ncbi:MAG: PilN domain-containing protein [Acidobacteriota bacterium]
MIRVNLLEGTAEQRVSFQKTKVAARRGQQLFMVAAALVIYVIVIGIDHLLTSNAFADAEAQLKVEQDESKKLEADINRKTQLEAELRQVEERIKIIKQLRAEQKGPVAMLSAINERLPGGQNDFKLSDISQKGATLRIAGSTSNQQIIADFVRQLEFSNGLFSGVQIAEVKAEELKDSKDQDESAETPKLYKFIINCAYNKPRAEGDDTKPQQPAAPAQGK